MNIEEHVMRDEIEEKVRNYFDIAFTPKPFLPGETPVPVSGKVFDAEELVLLVHAALDFWLTSGPYAKTFETKMAQTVGTGHAFFVNSGSSANLLAVTALTSPRLGEKRLRPGDEVITVAAAFPTTVNPILQNHLVPVFVDIQLPFYNVDVTLLERALSPKTRAVVLAHTLGNPFDLGTITEFCAHHELWLIEDCCDALGSTYRGQMVGTFGDIATFSFYPAHHITTGEGGCVLTNDPTLQSVIRSLRDWGRDCWCETGQDNTCKRRFQWRFQGLPDGYDHKYVYSHIGYNAKATDLQAAIGIAQLKKLPQFTVARKRNFQFLYRHLAPFEPWLILPEPTPESDPSWFGFPITVKPEAPFTRKELVLFLESKNIATRLLFAGNLLRQPAYQHITARTIGMLPYTDLVMERTFWVGTYPGLTEEMLDFVVKQIAVFMASKIGKETR